MSTEKMQGGVLGGVEDLYREVILDHFKSPKNKGSLPSANAQAEGLNPLCGDQIQITAVIEDDHIRDIKFEGHGCAISQSAASMITAAVKGRSLPEVKGLTQLYKAMFSVEEEKTNGPSQLTEDDLGDLVSLEGVKKYPVRIKCALLSANTLLETIDNFFKKGKTP